MPSQRFAYLDIAAGIMTLWVMVFHALYPIFGHDELRRFNKMDWYDKCLGMLIVLATYAIILPMVNVIINRINVQHP